jgi:hypothetical protein
MKSLRGIARAATRPRSWPHLSDRIESQSSSGLCTRHGSRCSAFLLLLARLFYVQAHTGMHASAALALLSATAVVAQTGTCQFPALIQLSLGLMANHLADDLWIPHRGLQMRRRMSAARPRVS